MIITFTPNPSLDRTVLLDRPLTRGAVHRAEAVTVEAAGKGINVARVLHHAGQDVRALLPAGPTDPILAGLAGSLPHRAVAIDNRVRTNITLTEADGTTTKVNEAGPTLTDAQVADCTAMILEEAAGAAWVALSGSLPPGAPVDWYARLVAALAPLGCKVAVDTSDAPLEAIIDALPGSACDLIKPNSEELAQLTGADAETLESSARAGNPRPVIDAARSLVDRGIGAVLATLGGAGAVLVTTEGAWFAQAPRITVRSTVGAGDSSVAGYILAAVRGADPGSRLQSAVAHGSAAAGLPGTTLPRPDDVHPDAVLVTRIDQA